MSDALPLPPRPHLDYYRTLARDLTGAARSGTVHDWAARWVGGLAKLAPIEWLGERALPRAAVGFVERQWTRFVGEHLPHGASALKLTDAQFFIARLHGFASWPRFAHHVE